MASLTYAPQGWDILGLFQEAQGLLEQVAGDIQEAAVILQDLRVPREDLLDSDQEDMLWLLSRGEQRILRRVPGTCSRRVSS